MKTRTARADAGADARAEGARGSRGRRGVRACVLTLCLVSCDPTGRQSCNQPDSPDSPRFPKIPLIFTPLFIFFLKLKLQEAKND